MTGDPGTMPLSGLERDHVDEHRRRAEELTAAWEDESQATVSPREGPEPADHPQRRQV